MPDQGQQSSLRQAVDRILGFSPGGQQQQSDFQLAAKPMMSDISNLSNTDWKKTLGTSSAITNPAPIAAPIAAPVLPQITYAQQLQNDLALSGITGKQADSIINNTLTAGGYDTNTVYDPNSAMNLNPGILSGTVKVTKSHTGF